MASTVEEPAVASVHPVRGRADVVVARRAAQRLGLRVGLSQRHATEIAIVVSELATNIVKYGVRGEVAFTWLPGMPGTFTVVAKDVGPPIHDLESALADGCDDRGPIDPALLPGRGGLGSGLGAVVRLADRFECRQDAGGKEITVRFFR
ncbi:MAG TPA: ATP-binding protein [Solirubrobacterales bacterium]|nr:ATP-binding protein [Solirubrobacterales bacterium]